MASAIWLVLCLQASLTQGQVIPNTFNVQPSISPIGISSNADNVMSLNNLTASNNTDVPIDLSQLFLKLIKLAQQLVLDQPPPPFPPGPPNDFLSPDLVDNSLDKSSSETSDDANVWFPVALIIDSDATSSPSDSGSNSLDALSQQPQQAFNIVYGVDSGNAANQLDLAHPIPTFTATQQQPGSFAQSSAMPPAYPIASSAMQTMQPPMPQSAAFGMNLQQQQPFFTASNSLMPMNGQDDSLPLTFNNVPVNGYGQWPLSGLGHWVHPWGRPPGPFNWMNSLQDNKVDNDQQVDDDNDDQNIGQGSDHNVDSDEWFKPGNFNWRHKLHSRFDMMDRQLLGPRMHGRTEEAHHRAAHFDKQEGQMEEDEDDNNDGSVEEEEEKKKNWGGSTEQDDNGEEMRQDDTVMDRASARGRRGHGCPGCDVDGPKEKRHGRHGQNCLCNKITRILDEMRRKHRGGRRQHADDN